MADCQAQVAQERKAQSGMMTMKRWDNPQAAR